MDKFFRQKTLAAVLFLVCLFALSFFNIRATWSDLQYPIAALFENGFSRDSANGLETVINDGVYQKRRFIDVFGYLQRLMYKNEQSDFETVKDSGGMLHEARFANEPDNTLALAESLGYLRSGIRNHIPILYVMPPDKYIRGFTAFPTGIPHIRSNETADSFLRMLSLYDIDAVDLREKINASGISPDKLFYKTDARWTTEANFWAFTELVELLRNQYGMNLDANRFLTDPNHYNRITYPASYLGGLGKRAGMYYAGADDFTVIYPKFDTDYTVSMGYSYIDEHTMTGRFEDALLSAEPFQRSESADYILSDKYSSYLLVNRGVAHIKNNSNPDGPKIAFISDSMIIPAVCFLSAACSDIYMIDPMLFSGSPSELLYDLNLELIIVSFCPQNLDQSHFTGIFPTATAFTFFSNKE